MDRIRCRKRGKVPEKHAYSHLVQLDMEIFKPAVVCGEVRVDIGIPQQREKMPRRRNMAGYFAGIRIEAGAPENLLRKGVHRSIRGADGEGAIHDRSCCEIDSSAAQILHHIVEIVDELTCDGQMVYSSTKAFIEPGLVVRIMISSNNDLEYCRGRRAQGP